MSGDIMQSVNNVCRLSFWRGFECGFAAGIVVALAIYGAVRFLP